MKDTLEILEILKTLIRLDELDNSSERKGMEQKAEVFRRRPQPVLAQYDRCRGRRRKAVVGMDENGDCGGCHVRASRGLLLALQRGSEIQVCEHCGAYLRWETVFPNTSALPQTTTP